MLILIKFARCRSMATSALFRWVRRGPTSRFWCSLLCHTSIRWYIRRFWPRLRVSVTVESCGTIAVSLHGSKVTDQGLCVRGARVQRGDQRTEPRRLSGVSSLPVKVGAAGTRLSFWNAGTRTWLLAFPKERLEDPAHWLDLLLLHNKALSFSSTSLDKRQGGR